jgi:hypothetical protein
MHQKSRPAAGMEVGSMMYSSNAPIRYKFLALLTLAAFAFETPAQEVASALPAVPADVRAQLAKLKPGSQVTIKLSQGKKLTGEVREINPDSLQLRVDRGFFRYRTETVLYTDMIVVKKETPTWVLPVIVLGIVGGVCIGIAACVQSGACTN